MLLVWVETTLQYSLQDGWKLKIYAVSATVLNLLHTGELIIYTAAFGVLHIFNKKQILVVEAILQIFVFLSIGYFLTSEGNYENFMKGIHVCNLIALARSFRLIIII